MRLTKYARKIAQIVDGSSEHLTAEQIFLRMKEEYPGIVLASVYNNLNMLSDTGRVRRLLLEGSPDRFDKTLRHDHVVCNVCGRLSDFKFRDLTGEIEEQLGGSIESYDLKISYICPECRRAMKKNQSNS